MKSLLKLSCLALFSIGIFFLNESYSVSETSPQKSAIAPPAQPNDFEIAIHEMMQGQFNQSIPFLEKIASSQPEAAFLLAIAALQDHKFQKALDSCQALPEPYRSSSEIKTVSMIALIHLNEYDVAAKIRALPEGAPLKFSPAVEALMKQEMALFLPAYREALFLDKVENNPVGALAKYREILKSGAPLTSDMYLQKAELESELHFFSHAISDFTHVEGVAGQTGLGLTFAKRGQFREGVTVFRKAQEQSSQKYFNFADFAKFYMLACRFDLAMIEQRAESSSLTTAEKLQQIELLIHLNQMKRAALFASRLHHNELQLHQQIELARLMLYCQDKGPAYALINQKEHLSYRSLYQLLELHRTLGFLEEATFLMQAYQDKIQSSSVLLLQKAEILLALSKKEEALLAARAAATLNPEDTFVTYFLDCNTTDPLVLKQRLEHIEKMPTLTYQAKFLFRLSQDDTLIPSENKKKELWSLMQDLQKELKAAATLSPQFPENLFALGLLYEALHNSTEAQHFYDKAVELDHSFTPALLQKATIFIGQGRFDMAKNVLTAAAVYDFSNPTLWIKLAECQYNTQDFLGAKASTEQALHFKPNDPLILVHYARLLLELNNPDLAFTYLQKALALAPNDEEVVTYTYMSLFNPRIMLKFATPQELEKERTTLYNKLHALNPKEAELIKQAEQKSGT